jgi:1-acyl-sn-glycerol-3-phosphate acyltransferase
MSGQPFHTANKNPLGEWLVTRVLMQPTASRVFHDIHVYADPAALRLSREPELPAIFCATHTSWWDGYMAGLLNRRVFKRDSYLMMEEANLARYWFFTWIGVFGVDRDDPRKATASIEYSSSLLSGEQNRALWIFPQGTITHPDKRPLGVYGGVSHIARRVGRCAIVPVALRYEFRLEQAPDAFARIGSPLLHDPAKERLSSKEATARLDAAMSQNDDRLHADLVEGRLGSYRTILRGRKSVSAVWDNLVGVFNSGK